MILRHSILLVQPPGNDLSMWIAVSIGALGLLYLFMRPKGRKKDPLSVSPNFNLSQQRSVERQMENLLVELSSMARQITAQLDTRAAKLEVLIKEADDRLAALRAATANGAATIPQPTSHQTAVEVRTAAIEADPIPPAPQQPETDQRYAEVYALADDGHSPLEIARQLGQPTGEVQLILALRPR